MNVMDKFVIDGGYSGVWSTYSPKKYSNICQYADTGASAGFSPSFPLVARNERIYNQVEKTDTILETYKWKTNRGLSYTYYCLP
jgi:hypothetical protein